MSWSRRFNVDREEGEKRNLIVEFQWPCKSHLASYLSWAGKIEKNSLGKTSYGEKRNESHSGEIGRAVVAREHHVCRICGNGFCSGDLGTRRRKGAVSVIV